MTLHDFLTLITDEEARIELEIEFDDDEEYTYSHFWYSDYVTNDSIAKSYRNFKVTGYSFLPRTDNNVDITIEIKPK